MVLRKGKTRITLQGLAAVGKRNAANEAIIRSFYAAFARRDAAGMARSYATTMRFKDRVFPIGDHLAPYTFDSVVVTLSP